MKSISIVAPAHNEKGNILPFIESVEKFKNEYNGSSTSFKTTKNPLSSVNSGFFRKNNSCSVFLQFFFPANFKFFQYFSIIFTKFIW